MVLRRICSCVVLLTFISSNLIAPHHAYADAVANLPVPGAMINLSTTFEPMLIKGLKVHPENPFEFDFIVDPGTVIPTQVGIQNPTLQAEANRLIKYFLASMTIPEKDLWVNLSPYERNRMISDNLGQTEMGRDMLAQDYILKQLTASLIYPEKELGKKFWDTVYAKAQQQFGQAQIPVNTFNKVWIVADKADVFERANVAYVVGAHLKVMLEEDYKALNKNLSSSNASIEDPNTTHHPNTTHTAASNVIRQIILPELEKEVNQGQHFAPLRQMFYSMILASWYKTALKDAILTQIYGNQNKVQVGINALHPQEKDQIFQRYLEAYKKGVFNYIKEDVNATTKQSLPRKYFSGGENIWSDALDHAQTVHSIPQGTSISDRALMINVRVTPESSKVMRVDGIDQSMRAIMHYTKVMRPSEIVEQVHFLKKQAHMAGFRFDLTGTEGEIFIKLDKFPKKYIRVTHLTGFSIFEGNLYVAHLDSNNSNRPSFAMVTPDANFSQKALNKNIPSEALPPDVREDFGFNEPSFPPMTSKESVNADKDDVAMFGQLVSRLNDSIDPPPRYKEQKISSYSSLEDVLAAETLMRTAVINSNGEGFDRSSYDRLEAILKGNFSRLKKIATARAVLLSGVNAPFISDSIAIIENTLKNYMREPGIGPLTQEVMLASATALQSDYLKGYHHIAGRIFLDGLNSKDLKLNFFKALLWDSDVSKNIGYKDIQQLKDGFKSVLFNEEGNPLLRYLILRLAAKGDLKNEDEYIHIAWGQAKDIFENDKTRFADTVMAAAGLVELLFTKGRPVNPIELVLPTNKAFNTVQWLNLLSPGQVIDEQEWNSHGRFLQKEGHEMLQSVNIDKAPSLNTHLFSYLIPVSGPYYFLFVESQKGFHRIFLGRNGSNAKKALEIMKDKEHDVTLSQFIKELKGALIQVDGAMTSVNLVPEVRDPKVHIRKVLESMSARKSDPEMAQIVNASGLFTKDPMLVRTTYNVSSERGNNWRQNDFLVRFQISKDDKFLIEPNAQHERRFDRHTYIYIVSIPPGKIRGMQDIHGLLNLFEDSFYERTYGHYSGTGAWWKDNESFKQFLREIEKKIKPLAENIVVRGETNVFPLNQYITYDTHRVLLVDEHFRKQYPKGLKVILKGKEVLQVSTTPVSMIITNIDLPKVTVDNSMTAEPEGIDLDRNKIDINVGKNSAMGKPDAAMTAQEWAEHLQPGQKITDYEYLWRIVTSLRTGRSKPTEVMTLPWAIFINNFRTIPSLNRYEIVRPNEYYYFLNIGGKLYFWKKDDIGFRSLKLLEQELANKNVTEAELIKSIKQSIENDIMPIDSMASNQIFKNWQEVPGVPLVEYIRPNREHVSIYIGNSKSLNGIDIQELLKVKVYHKTDKGIEESDLSVREAAFFKNVYYFLTDPRGLSAEDSWFKEHPLKTFNIGIDAKNHRTLLYCPEALRRPLQGYVVATLSHIPDGKGGWLLSASYMGDVSLGVMPVIVDHAQLSNAPGGIDLDRNKMNMSVSKDKTVGGVDVKFDQAMIEDIRRHGFDGLNFKINSIMPVNLPVLLGLRREEDERLAKV